MTRHFAPILPLTLAILISAGAAHAGPTVAAELDLGTSTTHVAPVVQMQSSPVVLTSPLYMVGFTLRAGWRFDVRSFFLLPEIGGGYDVERDTTAAGLTGTWGSPLSRFFGGLRAGWSGVLGPRLRIEPAIFGHAGVGVYSPSLNGTLFDVGASLDLRILGNLLVGVHGGYDVVTVWHPAAPGIPGRPTTGGPVCVNTATTATGPVCLAPPPALPPHVDPWVGYGIHAGYLFW